MNKLLRTDVARVSRKKIEASLLSSILLPSSWHCSRIHIMKQTGVCSSPGLLPVGPQWPVGLSQFQGFFPSETWIIASVTFTKCLYAQLVQKRFMPGWQRGYRPPPASYFQDYAHELGMNLLMDLKFSASNVSHFCDSKKSFAANSSLWPASLKVGKGMIAWWD